MTKRIVPWVLVGLFGFAAAPGCESSTPGPGGVTGTGGQSGKGGTGGVGGLGGAGGAGGVGGTISGSGGSSGAGGAGGSAGSADAGVDAPADVAADMASADAAKETRITDAISGTPDGGAYGRAGWTCVSMPPFPTGVKAMGQDLKYANALDGNFNTRWSTGDTTSPAQTIGDSFTLDMKEAHVFSKVEFWAGGVNGMGGPDPRDYPGALDLSVSEDCVTFGPTIGMGKEPVPGCQGNACNKSFVITLAAPATARCIRLTLTQRLQLGGGIWWAISEIFVLP